MINNVTLVGRLTKDPNVRQTQSNVTVAQFTLAVDRNFTNAQGEREADFINIVVFRNQAEQVGKYLAKGRLCGVEGRMQSRKYEKDGQMVFVTEVVANSVQFLDSGNKQNQQQNNNYQLKQNNGYQPPQNNNYQQQGNYQPQNNGYQPPQNNNYQTQQNNSYQPPQQNQQSQPPQNQQQGNPFNNGYDINDDDLPF
ncbi:single-stranded DNA-binding protein [Staphylococcus epidermidis]|uniref:single-stranded DNA-binding protein n=1 Tax=Staphylococcus epidermidis TaxID=1282 RepID=UPI0011A77ABD|nr:single-stranded DNA-binding protein [Staphylococcus epidermidis]MCG1138989.1 single-stranded DNA-binding protein [Staphylococcus epidermidis]MCG1143660.1 single-stranded DNA-binding protein [Staphylococcus epidermidis]MCG1926586.1 single-stranded DNA-binding protein [Staphylococcus epidermidis]MCG2470505.1 single-stranded DNA-binding protein [Staphylococcus epidermidis]MDH8802988.1 single-stranded DNA-binding protein [Staphylococcus epidermidis]